MDGNYAGELIVNDGGSLLIKGGYYKYDPSDYLADGYAILPYKMGDYNYYVFNLNNYGDKSVIDATFVENNLKGNSKEIFDYYIETQDDSNSLADLYYCLKDEYLTELYNTYKTVDYSKIIFNPYMKIIAEEGNLNSEKGWLKLDYKIFLDVYGVNSDNHLVKLNSSTLEITNDKINTYGFEISLPTFGLKIEGANHISGERTIKLINDDDYEIYTYDDIEYISFYLNQCSKLVINPDSSLPNDVDAPIIDDDDDDKKDVNPPVIDDDDKKDVNPSVNDDNNNTGTSNNYTYEVVKTGVEGNKTFKIVGLVSLLGITTAIYLNKKH